MLTRSLASALAVIAGLLAVHTDTLADDPARKPGTSRKPAPSKFETAAPLSDDRGAIDWSPATDTRLPAVAAYGPTGVPLVLYNPRLLAGHPRPIARFLAMRQEVVMIVLEGAKKQNIAPRSVERSDAGSSSFVPESVVYPLVARYGAFGNVSQVAFGPHVIDCIALLFMPSHERQTVAFYASENSRFFADAFDPPHDLMERGRALTDCRAMDPGVDEDRARRSFLSDWGVSSR